MSIISLIGTNRQALANVETEIGIASQNIGNAQNKSYVRRETSTSEVTGGGAVVDVSRATDQALQTDLLDQTGRSSGADLANSVYQQLEDLTGSSSGSPSLVTAAQNLVTAFQNLATTPDSATAKQSVLGAAQALVKAVQSLASGIDQIGTQTLNGAKADITTLNKDLGSIATLNGQIQAATAAGKPTADLEDQRDAALNEVATLVPVRSTTNADGTISLATPSGVSLVSGTVAARFAISAPVQGAGGAAGTDAKVTLVNDPSGTSLNGAFTSGRIGAALDLIRVDDAGANDTSGTTAPLEKARRQLDAFVDQFYATPPSTPTAFQSAYNGAATGSGELGSNLFVIASQGPGGTPQTAAADRYGFQVNSALTAGTATIKAGAGSVVASALTGKISASSLSAGDVTGFTGSLTDLAQAIANAQTGRASAAKSAADQDSTTLSSVQTAYSNQTGVSVDTELSQLVVLQNSYNASAKVLSIVNTMFQSLTSALT